MATEAEDYTRILATLRAKLAEATAAVGPSYSVEGQSVDKAAYVRGLVEEIKAVKGLLAGAEVGEVITQVRGL